MTTQELEQRIAFRIEEAARVIGASRSKMYELVASGEIPSFRVGRAVRVSKKAPEEWIAHQESHTAAEAKRKRRARNTRRFLKGRPP
ncbi:MAG TPA: excisionase family DNA-binding protein [Thermomicrobiales bacterium]|nr:excisionase family DNA-binding protein [Thermomicrobiales bacterium]